MSKPWLVVIDPQRIFADPASDWCAPRFAETVAPITALVQAFGTQRTLVTRWVPGTERVGSWRAYFEAWPFADKPDDDPQFALVEAARGWSAHATVDVSTFGKYGPALLARTGPTPTLVLCGVATDCCVLSTALAAADAGATVTVVSDACAGSNDDNNAAALQVMGLYPPQITVTTSAQLLASLR